MSRPMLWGMDGGAEKPRAKAVPTPVPKTRNQCQTTSAKTSANRVGPHPPLGGFGVGAGGGIGTGWHKRVLAAKYRRCPWCLEALPEAGIKITSTEPRKTRRGCRLCGKWAPGEDWELVY